MTDNTSSLSPPSTAQVNSQKSQQDRSDITNSPATGVEGQTSMPHNAEDGAKTVDEGPADTLEMSPASFNMSGSNESVDAIDHENANPATQSASRFDERSSSNKENLHNLSSESGGQIGTALAAAPQPLIHRPAASNLPSPVLPSPVTHQGSAAPDLPQRTSSLPPDSTKPRLGRRRAASILPRPIPLARQPEKDMDTSPNKYFDEHNGDNRVEAMKRLFDRLVELPEGVFRDRERAYEPGSTSSSPEMVGRLSLDSDRGSANKKPQAQDPFPGAYLVTLTPEIMAQLEDPAALEYYDVFVLFDFVRQIPPDSDAFQDLHNCIIRRLREGKHAAVGFREPRTTFRRTENTDKGLSATQSAPATSATVTRGHSSPDNTNSLQHNTAVVKGFDVEGPSKPEDNVGSSELIPALSPVDETRIGEDKGDEEK